MATDDKTLTRPLRAWQWEAWRFYGLPYDASAGRRSAQQITPDCETGRIGELRFLVSWMAEQIGRIDWRVLVDGEPLTEKIVVPGKGTVDHDRSKEFISQVTNGQPNEMAVQVAINKLVAGELDYALHGDMWKVLSVIDPDKAKILGESPVRIDGPARLWPHPADPDEPDSPVGGVLDILREIESLQVLSRAQNRNRAGIAGIAFLSDAVEFSGDVAGPAGLQEAFRLAMETPIADLALGASPLVGGVPHEAMQGGAKILDWIVPERPYDERIDARLDFALHRLGMSFPTPPEVLFGLQSATRATAFVLQENAYREHVEPTARHVAETFQAALRLVMQGVPEGSIITVEPDPTNLLARKHSVADAFNAWDRGLVKAEWVLRTLGVPIEMSADEDDIERIERINRRGRERPIRDQAQRVDEEPVAGAAGNGVAEFVEEPL
jgi:hypothetical protein